MKETDTCTSCCDIEQPRVCGRLSVSLETFYNILFTSTCDTKWVNVNILPPWFIIYFVMNIHDSAVTFRLYHLVTDSRAARALVVDVGTSSTVTVILV